MSEHLSAEQLNDVVDRRMQPETMQEAVDHLYACEDCRVAMNRIGVVVAAAAELRTPVPPSRDLWPAVSRRTVHARSIRGPWLFTLILSVLVISGTSVWLARTQPWKSIASTQAEASYDARAPEVLLLLSEVRKSGGDAYKRSELLRLAPAALRTSDSELKTAFFEAVRSILSSAERRGLLLSLRNDFADPAVARGMLEAARGIASDSERSATLVGFASYRPITDPGIRALYLEVTATILSNAQREKARSALLAR